MSEANAVTPSGGVTPHLLNITKSITNALQEFSDNETFAIQDSYARDNGDIVLMGEHFEIDYVFEIVLRVEEYTLTHFDEAD